MADKKVFFYFYLVIVFLLTNCQSEQVPKDFWQGKWTLAILSFENTPKGEPIILGYLNLEDEEYNFTAVGSTSEIQDLRQRLWFLDEYSGLLEVEVKIDNEQSFSTLEDGTVLAYVKFGTDNNRWSRERFQIRINQNENKLYFHGDIGEFQFWEIEKDLSES